MGMMPIITDIYEIFIHNHEGDRLYCLRGWDRLVFSQRLNAPWNHEIDITIPPEDLIWVPLLRAIEPDFIVLIYRYDIITGVKDLVYEGFNLTVVDQANMRGDLIFSLYGQGYACLLDRRIVVPPTGDDQAVETGPAETVMKAFVDSEIANPTDLDRHIPSVVIEGDSGTGNVVTRSVRYENLLTTLQGVAEEGALTFGVYGADPPVSFTFRARPIWGLDRRINSSAGNPPMFFNYTLNNMEIPILSKNFSEEKNLVYVGGEGQGAGRTILELENITATALSPFARKESFTDARGGDTVNELTTVGTAYLQKNRRKELLSFNVRKVEGSLWMRNWNLGDIVTAKYSGTLASKRIVEVRVTVTSGETAIEPELIEVEMEDVDDVLDAYLAEYTIPYNDPDPFTYSADAMCANYICGGPDDLIMVDDGGNVFQTNDFNTPSGGGGPTWVKQAVVVDGTAVQFVVDAFSPLYTTGAGAINGWVTTTTKEYFYSNLLGATGAVLQHTFRNTSSLRSSDFEYSSQGKGVVVSNYADGTWITYTVDGVTWSTEALIDGGQASTLPPGAVASSKLAGLRYMSGMEAVGDGAGYRTLDYGTTTNEIDNAPYNGTWIDSGEDGAADLHIPYEDNADEKIVLYGKTYAGGRGLFKAGALSATDISPTATGAGDPPIVRMVHMIELPGSYVDIFDGTWTAEPNTVINAEGASSVRGHCTIDNVGVWIHFAGIVYITELSYYMQYVSGTGNSLVITYYDSSNVVLQQYGSFAGGWPHSTPGTGPQHDVRSISIQHISCVGWDPSTWDFGGLKFKGYVESYDTSSYGPWLSRWQISTSCQDRDIVAVMGIDEGLANNGFWTSVDEGLNWTERIAPSGIQDYERVAIAGDNADNIYIFGNNGAIAFSNDGAVSFDDRMGNIATLSPGRIIGIAGGI